MKTITLVITLLCLSLSGIAQNNAKKEFEKKYGALVKEIMNVDVYKRQLTAFFLYSVRYCQFFPYFCPKSEDKPHFGIKNERVHFILPSVCLSLSQK